MTELKVYGGFLPVLYPTMEIQRVCDSTSPGFKALEEFNASSFGIDYSLDEEEVTKLWEIAKERKVVELKRLFASGEASPLDEGLELGDGAVLVVEQATLFAVLAIGDYACGDRLGDSIDVLLLSEPLLLLLYGPQPISHRPVSIVWRVLGRVGKVALELNHLDWF